MNNNNNNNNDNDDDEKSPLIVTDVKYAGLRKHNVDVKTGTFDPNDPDIKRDIIAMILQYLQKESYMSSAMTLQDESNVKLHESINRRLRFKRLKKAILAGEWADVEKLCNKNTMTNSLGAKYLIYKQQFLETIDRQEFQKAYSFLNKKLKPLEHLSASAAEFQDLCYLLTCKSVREAPSFRDWQGANFAREKLVQLLKASVTYGDLSQKKIKSHGKFEKLPTNRLITMLQQSVAYQIEFGSYHPKLRPKITSLFEDYSCFIVPNSELLTLSGHQGSVKCVEFVGENGLSLVSGGSDNIIRIWNTETGLCTGLLKGHTGRIWDLSTAKKGNIVASASADRIVKLWHINDDNNTNNNNNNEIKENDAVSSLLGQTGDVYSVQIDSSGRRVVSGGYDSHIRLYDIESSKILRTLNDHNSSVSSVVFNRLGNLIISGSKDKTIKFWDILSGSCVNTFDSHLWEVSSVTINQSGTYVLSSSKDNCNRIWDVRMMRPMKKFKGHQNTTTNFIGASFGPQEALVVGGSQDGYVYIWDIMTESLLQKLKGHNDIVYSAKWNPSVGMLASASHDSMIKTWWFDGSIVDNNNNNNNNIDNNNNKNNNDK